VMSLPCTGKTKVGTKWQWEVQVEPKKRERKKERSVKEEQILIKLSKWKPYMLRSTLLFIVLFSKFFIFRFFFVLHVLYRPPYMFFFYNFNVNEPCSSGCLKFKSL
jgi:hypothetical protein